MRLDALDHGHTLKMKLLFFVIRLVSRFPAPDVVKTLRYRPEFFGGFMSAVFQEVMRGPSAWSVGERELMAAYVSRVNACEFWTNAHGAVASKVLGEDTVQAVLADVETAPIAEPLRATLKLLRKVTREHEAVTADDVRPLLALGITPEQIEDAIDVAFAFNVITRLADAFRFEVGPRAAFDAGAERLLSRGYGG